MEQLLDQLQINLIINLGIGNGTLIAADFTAGANQSFAGAGTAAQTNTLTGSMTVTIIKSFSKW